MLHIYHGDGKGKTTAAIGQAIRLKGAGKSVLFVQFLKDGNSSEVPMLKAMGIPVLFKPLPAMFVDVYDASMVKEVIALENQLFREIEDHYDAIILDEILDVITLSFIQEGYVYDMVKTWCKDKEIIMTGRQPSQKLKQLSSYLTEMKAKKHPYQQGIVARRGVEF